MSIYSIPPLVSSVLLFIFVTMGLFKGREKKENLLFSFVCLLGFFLNLDKTLLTILQDGNLALMISRIDHFFLVFIIPLYLHFTSVITGRREYTLLYKILYMVALFLAPLTQSDYYLKGVNRYFFGFFATPGPLFYIFGTLSALSVLLSLSVLLTSLRSEKVGLKRARIKYIILSIGVAAFVNHFDVLVMEGWEIYPLGNFVFLPMALLGYAIYKHDIMEWRIFLNRGLQFFVLLLFSGGIFTAFLTFAENIFGQNVGFWVKAFFAFLPTIIIFFAFKEKIQEWIVTVTLKEQIRRRQILKELSFSILRIRSVEEAKDIVFSRLGEIFSLSACEIRPCEKDEPTEPIRFLNENDPDWERGFTIGIFVPSEHFPSYLLLGEKKDLSLYTEEEIELLSILANNLALAMDNAHILRKLKEFTESLERMVEERTKALIRSESLAAVGRLASGVAHELNNPLGSVMSTIEYHLDRLDKKSSLYEDLDFCLRELRRADGIVKSLLQTARQRDEEKGPVDVHKAIDDALRILYTEYRKKQIEIVKSYSAKNPFIIGVHGRLCQVFINLIKNGIEAIGIDKGKIEIKTDNAQDGSVMVTVEDTGSGMDEETKANLFKPFFTTKAQGVGLGLYITYEIVRALNGQIRVESEKGKGTRFELTFPAYQRL